MGSEHNNAKTFTRLDHEALPSLRGGGSLVVHDVVDNVGGLSLL